MTDTGTTFESATLCIPSNFGSIGPAPFGDRWERIQVRSVTVKRVEYAQYDNALEVTFRKKGGRHIYQLTSPNERAVVIDGWKHGHGLLDDPTETRATQGGVTEITGKRRGISAEWAGDFEQWLAESGAKIRFDSSRA